MQDTQNKDGASTFNTFFPLSPELVRRLLGEADTRQEWGEAARQNVQSPS